MQMPDNNQRRQDEALEAPPRLVSALKGLPRERLFIPPTLDESILRAARKHLEAPQPVRPVWLRLVLWGAAAAAVVVLAVLPRFTRQPATGPAHDAALARWDLNHDGRVDILDAFALARQLKRGGAQNPQLDLNGDGVVDERDVAAIAARAVKLDGGGRS
jgi:hypothetical protein